ncbi:hypothetical protein CP985_13455 [Malaciobacter mytili LMG 24559]|uniref:Transposase n=1 Tax=Malaciobacter mytili LMG 24559 TaxID=1032238 RepID=A0AAX2ABP9_9BACT|nr:DUF6262 family protein [Malaciobacter mytili]AXH16491.1 hypothetical protein AMYT_a0193 [Malaciobacter mytili LMG 24559]RXK12996.1 hypothetical protein CP985_13455 [Malaciobacter mytili LMG 24559]
MQNNKIKKRVKNEGLKRQEEQRKEDTKNKILEAIEKLKKKKEKINFSRISNESGISRNTLYTYRDFIGEHTTITVNKSNEVQELEHKIKELNQKNKVLSSENRDLKDSNSKLVEQIMALKEYIKTLE